MKKFYFIFAALVGVALTSCTNDEVTATSNLTEEPTPPGIISFSGGAGAITRADLYGSAAAAKLGNKFVVYGTKHVNAEDNTIDNDAVVFNNFQVAYTASTAGTTASNSSDWDYLGLQSYDASPSSQGIKYWDYSATNGHTFYAFSSSDISYPANGSDLVSVTKTTTDGSSLYNKGYAVTVKDGATLNNLYFSDRVEVPKTDYDKTVSFTFRNIGAKVRFGFYETIPGYTVKIDKFYIDEDADAAVTTFPAMKDGKNDGFYAALQNVKNATAAASQTLNVTYYESTTSTQVINRPKLTQPTAGYNYYLKLGNAAGIIDVELGKTSSAPTWVDGTSGDYTPVFPFEGNSNPLLLKLDFTMYADDGSPDVIQVKGARAIVPAQYVQWKSNFAYTYIFKISDKSNGTTGDVDPTTFEPTDPEGLKPITFDAIVVDVTDELQQTITSVSTRSITTYAEGAIANEYNHGEPIYTVITTKSSGSVITPSAIGDAAKNAQVYKLSRAASEAEVLALLNGSPINDLTKTATTGTEAASIEATVPLTDNTTPAIANVKFTPESAGTYAYVYTTTPYVAPTPAAVTGAYDSSVTYYMLSGSGAYYAVSVPNEAAYEANKAKLYTLSGGTAGEYDVKVIKVQ